MSLTGEQLLEYVATARAAEEALGSGGLGMSAVEADVRAAARRSVVATGPIPAGTILTAEMLAVKRPGGGIEPSQLDEVVGRRAGADIAPDTVLRWELLR
jgi:sialic acid synthase SpsE